MRLACIDVGSNTTRLLVADAIPGGFSAVLNERAFTLIGRSLSRDGRIPRDKIDETAAATARMAAIAREAGAERVRAVATAAIRDAANGADLAGAIERRASVALEVLTGAEEARLAFRGAAHVIGGGGTLAVVDVGGGSTEIACGDARGRIARAESVRVGSSALAERRLATDPPTGEEIGRARDDVAAAFEGIGPLAADRAVAVGGSASSLEKLAGPELGQAELAKALNLLLGQPAAHTAARFGLDRERVRLLPAGLLILEELCRRLGRPLRICKGGLREGVILDMIGKP